MGAEGGGRGDGSGRADLMSPAYESDDFDPDATSQDDVEWAAPAREPPSAVSWEIAQTELHDVPRGVRELEKRLGTIPEKVGTFWMFPEDPDGLYFLVGASCWRMGLNGHVEKVDDWGGDPNGRIRLEIAHADRSERHDYNPQTDEIEPPEDAFMGRSTRSAKVEPAYEGDDYDPDAASPMTEYEQRKEDAIKGAELFSDTSRSFSDVARWLGWDDFEQAFQRRFGRGTYGIPFYTDDGEFYFILDDQVYLAQEDERAPIVETLAPKQKLPQRMRQKIEDDPYYNSQTEEIDPPDIGGRYGSVKQAIPANAYEGDDYDPDAPPSAQYEAEQVGRPNPGWGRRDPQHDLPAYAPLQKLTLEEVKKDLLDRGGQFALDEFVHHVKRMKATPEEISSFWVKPDDYKIFFILNGVREIEVASGRVDWAVGTDTARVRDAAAREFNRFDLDYNPQIDEIEPPEDAFMGRRGVRLKQADGIGPELHASGDFAAPAPDVSDGERLVVDEGPKYPARDRLHSQPGGQDADGYLDTRTYGGDLDVDAGELIDLADVFHESHAKRKKAMTASQDLLQMLSKSSGNSPSRTTTDMPARVIVDVLDRPIDEDNEAQANEHLLEEELERRGIEHEELKRASVEKKAVDENPFAAKSESDDDDSDSDADDDDHEPVASKEHDEEEGAEAAEGAGLDHIDDALEVLEAHDLDPDALASVEEIRDVLDELLDVQSDEEHVDGNDEDGDDHGPQPSKATQGIPAAVLVDADIRARHAQGGGIEDRADAGLYDGEMRRRGLAKRRKNAGSMDPAGYAYEASTHCPGCAYARFGDALDDPDTEDSEGNPIHAFFGYDEHDPQGVFCDDCGGEIVEPSDEDQPSDDSGDDAAEDGQPMHHHVDPRQMKLPGIAKRKKQASAGDSVDGIFDGVSSRAWGEKIASVNAPPAHRHGMQRFAVGAEKIAAEDVPFDLFSGDDGHVSSAVRSIAALTVNRMPERQMRFAPSSPKLVASAEVILKRTLAKFKKSFSIDSMVLEKFEAVKVAAIDGAIVEGTFRWHLVLADHVRNRRGAIDVVVPIVGGLAVDAATIYADGRPIAFTRAAIDRHLNVRRDATRAGNRVPSVDRAFVEEF